MKKTLSIIITIAMLCSLMTVVPFSASAADPEGTAITDAAGFAAMTADGKYYLANDITVDATWGASVDAETGATTYATFAGTFDGNGKTITVSAPLFGSVGSATIKNFTVNGAIDGGTADFAAVASIVELGAVANFDNIVSNVDLTNGDDAGAIVGFVAKANDGGVITITNCVNNGDIIAGNRCGGIVGSINDGVLNIENCINNGYIESKTNYSGGILSRFGDGADVNDVATIKNCENNGDVVAYKSQVGGIMGYSDSGLMYFISCTNTGNISCFREADGDGGNVGGIVGNYANKEYMGACIIKDCVNAGDLTGWKSVGGIVGKLGNAKPSEGYYNSVEGCINYGNIVDARDDAAGIAAYIWGGSVGNGVDSCINFGDVTSKGTGTSDTDHSACDVAAGILGYVNASKFHVTNCVNFGTVTQTNFPAQAYAVLGNKNTSGCEVGNVWSVAQEGLAADNLGLVTVNTFTAAEVADGSAAAKVIAAAPAAYTLWIEGGDPIASVTPEYVFSLNSDNMLTVSVPVADDPVIPPVSTGDIAWVYVAIAAVSVLGVAVVSKKRREF